MVDIGVVWIREDLRINDNNALNYSTNNHENTVAIYIYDENKFKKIEAQKWWLSKSLEDLERNLKKFNIKLEITKGNAFEILKKISFKKKLSIYWNKIYEPCELNLDKKIKKELLKKKINFKEFKGNILNEYNEVTKNDGTPFKVFTPFWRVAENIYIEKISKKNSKIIKNKSEASILNKTIKTTDILPKKKWYKKFENLWKPTEEEAHKQLEKLIKEKILDYGIKRDFPGVEGTSKLSPYIKNGQIHVETIWKRCIDLKSKNISVRKYINELGWREFSHSLINYFPEMLKGNLRKEFDRFPWVKNENFLKAWKRGLTGYPIVDAGMRELYETGWMHNRIRMVVGSFLVKHLRINWQEGEKHFRNCLFDFNEANNVAQWQWVAGCGADAAPYFRIFNPILQGEKFDKEGLYVKKWVPELSKVPSKFIHKPWEMELKYQEAIKTVIGKNYPKPIVIHEEARSAALHAFQSLKKN